MILHVGTNDLRSIGPAELAKSIQSLAINIEENSPNTSVSISAILPRKESQISKNATLVNNSLKLICSQHHWNFIEHKNIKQTHLNRGGIHLSKGKAGSDILANNFKFHINNEYRYLPCHVNPLMNILITAQCLWVTSMQRNLYRFSQPNVVLN
jgi:hypothetical protein